MASVGPSCYSLLFVTDEEGNGWVVLSQGREAPAGVCLGSHVDCRVVSATPQPLPVACGAGGHALISSRGRLEATGPRTQEPGCASVSQRPADC